MDNYEESVEFQELLKDYQQSRRQGRNTYFDSDAFIDLAEYYMTHNPMEEAFEVIEDGLAFHPNEEALLSLKANVLISLSRFDEAETILEHLDPEEDHDVYYFHAQLACGKERDYEKAKKLFKKWLKIEMRECEDMPNQEEGATRKRTAISNNVRLFLVTILIWILPEYVTSITCTRKRSSCILIFSTPIHISRRDGPIWLRYKC